MKNAARFAALCFTVLGPALLQAADSPTLATARELKWTDVSEPAGAKQAPLWGDAKSGDNGMLLRWKFNSKVPDLVRNQDVHIVVMAGTFTVEIDGGYKEFGPGGFVSIPKGVKHTLGCEAAGECKVVMHHPGPVEITKTKGR
jgi:mannose-6-phosphate isomerase-like protein (cupin superfamily)